MKRFSEWSTPWNPFNSMKVLFWRDELLAMSRGETPVPVCTTIDPTNKCNMNCSWCIWGALRTSHPDSIPDKVLMEMPAFLKRWGTRSVCVGGGGEPFCHPLTPTLIRELWRQDIPVGTITNGVALGGFEAQDAVVDCCRWIGVSLDSASATMHRRIKRPDAYDAFKQICNNIEWIAGHRRAPKRPSIGLKFCIHHLNHEEIYQFAHLAKNLGADEVHFRPVFIPGYVFAEKVADRARELILEARADFETADFHVYGIVHKFDANWKRAIRFQKCRATPINAYFMADGTLALCCDRRDDPGLNLGPYYPFEKVTAAWGSPEHKAMLEKITPQSCGRCTQAATNEIIEKVILADEMTIEFV